MIVDVAKPAQGENASAAWRRALAEARSRKCSRIRFLPGRYDFYPGDCARKSLHFSNNDCGEKTIALHLEDLDDLEVTGENTLLFFHGRICPVVAENCSRLRLSGLVVDFEDSFVSDASVVEEKDGVCRAELYGKYRLEGGRLVFTGDAFDNRSGVLQIRPYDPDSGEMPQDADCTALPNRDIAEENGLIRLPGVFGAKAITIKHEDRLCPGIVLSGCSDVTVEDITIHHAAGMGLLAQFCTGVTLEKIRVVPAADRVVSSSDDALHLVECRGDIAVRDCRAAGMLDDALNVHGIYRPVTMAEEKENVFYLETGHPQQAGFPGARPGDTLELVKAASCRPLARLAVLRAEQLSPERTLVETSGPLPRELRTGCGARVLEPGLARLEVDGCDFSPLRGRGVLASGLAQVRVKNCRFHTSGAGVFIAGGCARWYETGPVGHAVIENNLFDNCCYLRHSSTREAVSVYPDLKELEPDFYYHGVIEVKGNRFISSRRPLVSVLSAERADVSGNTFELSGKYGFPPGDPGVFSFASPDDPAAVFKHVKTVHTENNAGFFTRG
ncbi:MAG: hypothetical protein IJS01_05390 [Lentisphaeria bacterium]|nr:hypothetical protein [Lentisphaeria bacterium]